jgi:hypothetical protein
MVGFHSRAKLADITVEVEVVDLVEYGSCLTVDLLIDEERMGCCWDGYVGRLTALASDGSDEEGIACLRDELVDREAACAGGGGKGGFGVGDCN